MHGDLGDQPADHGEVVAHVDRGDAVGAAHAADRVEHVPLRRDVESGGRLVEHDQRRPAGERHGQADALLLPAGQLMRIAPDQLGRRVKPGLAQNLEDPVLRVIDRTWVDPQRLPELGSNPQRRVQRGRRILRYVGDPCAPGRAQVSARQPEQIDAVEPDLAPADVQATAGVPEQRERNGGLARP